MFDYTALMNSLKEYKCPRDKVTALLRNNRIIRIKKGLYIENRKDWSKTPVKELAANLMYGPSYISLQYALAAYGMIPETAAQITSISFKKTKHYRTPVGDFIYRSVSLDHYLPGVRRIAFNGGISYFMASPEKALMDMLYFTVNLRSLHGIQSYILEDLRIDVQTVRGLNLTSISEMSAAAKSPKLRLCQRAIAGMTE